MPAAGAQAAKLTVYEALLARAIGHHQLAINWNRELLSNKKLMNWHLSGAIGRALRRQRGKQDGGLAKKIT